MKRKIVFPALLCAGASLFACATSAQAQARDPGVRSGAAGAGGALPGLSGAYMNYFNAGLADFVEVEAAADGLGPTMNLDSCGGCHLQPAVGGSSPAVNPQVAFAKKMGNSLPSFLSSNGPIREARFVRNANGSAGYPEPDSYLRSRTFSMLVYQRSRSCTRMDPLKSTF